MALKYFREATEELHRVTWPTRKQALYLVIAVIIATAIAGTFFGVVDTAFSFGWKYLLQLAAS